MMYGSRYEYLGIEKNAGVTRNIIPQWDIGTLHVRAFIFS